MKLWLKLLALACLATTPALALGQVDPQKALSTFKTAEGLEVSLFASEPMFVNPTCIDVDHKGRVWVCESVNYRTKLRNRPLQRKEGDRIVILEDSDGDGKADRATTFCQSPEILAPLGIAVAKEPTGPGYKVFVCQSPKIWVFEDSDGDGKADGPPRDLLTGFRGIDHDHGVHGILIGPDLKLYFTVGDSGVGNLQSSDGQGRKWTSNSTDCRAATVWRCDLDGKNLELIAHNFRNNYEACVDSFGTIFLSDNDDDGKDETRICYVMPGGNYGYHPRDGGSHWHEEQPGIVPKVYRTGRGSPTGICFYEGSLLPRKYHGQLLHVDAGPAELRCFHLTPRGAGYEAVKELLLSSSDKFFRPSDVCVAPDGSLMVSDWYDPAVGGHNIGDFGKGRIYRITPKGHRGYRVPEVKLDSAEGLLAALASPNLAVRYMAMAKLEAMKPEQARKTLASGTQSSNPLLKARVGWMLARVQARSEAALDLVRLLSDPDERFALQAIRIARDFKVRRLLKLPGVAPDPGKLVPINLKSPAQAREVLLAYRDRPLESLELVPFWEAVQNYQGNDRFYLCAIGIAVGSEPRRREMLLAEFGRRFPRWNDVTADLIWELRPPKVATMLEKWLHDGKLPAASRARIVDLLGDSEEKEAGPALLAVVQKDFPAEIRDRALANLRRHLPGKWKALAQGQELGQAIDGLLARAETRVMGLALTGAAGKIDLLPRVLALAADEKQSQPVRAAAIDALAQMRDAKTVAALDKLAQSSTLGVRAVEALGQLAVGAGRRPDDVALAARRSLRQVVQNAKAAQAVREAAVAGLATSQEGTVWLLELQDKGQLPADLRAETGRLLRSTPFASLRGRTHKAFPAPGKLDPKKLPAIEVLARRRGDAQRGKQLMAASLKNDWQCLKCHSIRGVGGQVGPDLSTIGKKGGRDNLLESILYPSKAIADQFVTWSIETKRGLSIQGLIAQETPQRILLRDANGKEYDLKVADIASRVKSTTSLMPDNLLAFMTETDLIDLVEYMTTLTTPALSVSPWHIAGPFEAGEEGLDRAFPPEKAVDLQASYQGKTGKIGWKLVRPNAHGYVDLRALHGDPASRSLSYAYQEIESPVDQPATLLIGPDDGCKVWLNGKLVHTDRRTQAATPEANAVQVSLKKGKNLLLLKISNGDGPHGFYFTLLSEQELKLAQAK